MITDGSHSLRTRGTIGSVASRAHRLLPLLLVTCAVGWLQGCGGSDGSNSATAAGSTSWVHHWNQIAIDASGLDHTPVQPGENRVFGEQFGPTRASRAMAIVHVAIFDAVNAIVGGYQSYTGVGRAPAGASMKAAISQAGHDTLSALLPTANRKPTALRSASKQRRRFSPCATTTARNIPSRSSASTSSPAMRPVSGGKIPSASSRLRSARYGAR